MLSSLFTSTTSFISSSSSAVANISSTSFVSSSISAVANISSTSFSHSVSVSETQTPSQSPVETPISASLSNVPSLSSVSSLAVITSRTSTIQETSTSPRLSVVLVSDTSSTSQAQSMGVSSTSKLRLSNSLPVNPSSLLSTQTVIASAAKSSSTLPRSSSHSFLLSTVTSRAASRTDPVNIVNTMTTSSKSTSRSETSKETPKSTQKAPPAPPTPAPPPKASSTEKPPPPPSHTSSKPPPPPPSPSPPPPPPPPHTTSSQRTTSASSSGNAAHSTTFSVQVVGPSSTSTSTLTTTPQTTLSNLVALTVTNASDGRTSLSTPALITILSTSTEPDGALVTLTNVVANSPLPNNSAESLNGKQTGFLHNQGAVAGVFVVVGIVAATLVAGIFFCVRHRRRIARRRQWISGMQRLPPSSLTGDPFQDPVDPPVAAYEANDDSIAQWDGRAGVRPMAERPHPGGAAPGLAGVGSEMHSQRGRGLLFNEAHLQRPAPGFLGVPFQNDRLREMTQSAQSTPSIYPVSLPPDDDFHHSEPSNSVRLPTDVVPPPRPPRSSLRDSVRYNHFDLPTSPAFDPPRPPRSSLRDSVKYKPLTPPSSDPPTPTDEAHTTESQKNLFVRRPVPEVRPYQTRDWS